MIVVPASCYYHIQVPYLLAITNYYHFPFAVSNLPGPSNLNSLCYIFLPRPRIVFLVWLSIIAFGCRAVSDVVGRSLCLIHQFSWGVLKPSLVYLTPYEISLRRSQTGHWPNGTSYRFASSCPRFSMLELVDISARLFDTLPAPAPGGGGAGVLTSCVPEKFDR